MEDSDTPVENPDEGTFDGTEEPEAEGEESVENDLDPDSWIAENAPDAVREYLTKSSLRHKDYTQKTMAVADERKRLRELTDAANAILLHRKEDSKAAPAESEPETPPDVRSGAKPEEVIEWYAKKHVEKVLGGVLGGLDLKGKMDTLQPLISERQVVRAYRKFETDNPDMNHKAIAPIVGKLLDEDPELGELASVDPIRAVSIAAKIAVSQAKLEKASTKNKQRRAAAPVSARHGSVVKDRSESPLEAATRAMKEEGLL